jgi:hypothetical protein
VITFSQWRPDGGWTYFEVADRIAPIGDDLPNPVMPAATKLGVPSVEVGQPMPSGAVRIGEGELPVGVVTPMDTSRLGQTLAAYRAPWMWFIAGAGVVGVIWLVLRRSERR